MQISELSVHIMRKREPSTRFTFTTTTIRKTTQRNRSLSHLILLVTEQSPLITILLALRQTD